MTERCPKCGGPVEKDALARTLLSGQPDMSDAIIVLHAISDTLEGIVTDYEIVDGTDDWQEAPDVLIQALTRLFQGCAECGREPMRVRTVQDTDNAVYLLNVGKRQAFRQAANVVADHRQNAHGRHDDYMALELAEAELRQLAEVP